MENISRAQISANFYADRIMYTSLVIAGGAMKVMASIGVFKYLEERDAISPIRTFVGTSAGALACLMLSLGYSSEEIKTMVLDSLADPSITDFGGDSIFNVLSNYGLNSGTSIEKLVERAVFKKCKKTDITFMDLAKITGKHLVVCVSNLTKERTEFMSVDTAPNLRVARAIHASCSLPLMYEPVEINGDMYLDGGLYNNFPIDFFPEAKLRDILGINICYKNYQKTDTFVNYVLFMFYSVLDKLHSKSVCREGANIITLRFDDDSDWFNLSELRIYLTPEKLDQYISMGYDRCVEYLKPK